MSTIKLGRVQEIALIGILSALNIASRLYLQALPNVKPVTSIIIISVFLFELAFAAKLTIVTTLVSGIFLGLGLHIFFQILAWIVICVLTDFIAGMYRGKGKMPPLLLMAIFSAIMGYVFGFVVSLEKLMIGGPTMFWTYYISGLSFDTLHAIGNFVFYMICTPIMVKVFIRGSKNLQVK